MKSLKSYRRLVLLLLAIAIGAGSLWYTRDLVDVLEREERNKVELWAKATRMIVMADSEQDLDFFFSITGNNTTVPVILTDGDDNIISSVNFDEKRLADPRYLEGQLAKMKNRNEPITIDLGDGFSNIIYYKDSTILTRLIYFPYIQLGVISLFILIAYLAFNSAKKAEENQIWASLTKETAHQLGTPTSSLGGWVEVLNDRYPDDEVSGEIALDVERLEKITERFSRIGTKPALKKENIIPIFSKTIGYLQKRVSSKVNFTVNFNNDEVVEVDLNCALFEWVVENISKNSIDAMGGEGTLTYTLVTTPETVVIDISDTGKGMPKKIFKKIFKPGFTTKQHGWGLGLSLAKRIVGEFHGGKLFVKESEVGKGTTMRIILKRRG